MASGTLYRTIGRARAARRPERETSLCCTDFFVMNNLLYSRMESGFPSNEDLKDEDVNVYLADLLESFMRPSRHETMKRYLCGWDAPLFESVCAMRAPRDKYMAYRMNADFILVQLGIFDNPGGRRPGSTPWLDLSRDVYTGRGKAYYRLAQSYCCQARMRPTAMSDVLGKLSEGFERYAGVLATMRSEYFNIIESLSAGELYHLGRSVQKEEMKGSLAGLHDRFLDAYSAYRKDRSEERRRELEEAASRIREIDPGFAFDPDML